MLTGGNLAVLTAMLVVVPLPLYSGSLSMPDIALNCRVTVQTWSSDMIVFLCEIDLFTCGGSGEGARNLH